TSWRRRSSRTSSRTSTTSTRTTAPAGAAPTTRSGRRSRGRTGGQADRRTGGKAGSGGREVALAPRLLLGGEDHRREPVGPGSHLRQRNAEAGASPGGGERRDVQVVAVHAHAHPGRPGPAADHRAFACHGARSFAAAALATASRAGFTEAAVA